MAEHRVDGVVTERQAQRRFSGRAAGHARGRDEHQAGGGGLLPAIGSRFTPLRPTASVKPRQVACDDPTAGLADGSSDVAFVWLPVPEPARFRWVVVATEPRLVALPFTHRRAGREVIDFAGLLDEPFLALPESAGRLRDYRLALDAGHGWPEHIDAAR